jgi:PAS domain S-box-containing protein
MKKLEFRSNDEELNFLRKILDTIPAIINVNQVEDINDPSTNVNLWSNQQLHDFTGYTREEISELGFNFFMETMHPDDISLIRESADKLNLGHEKIHGGMMRLRPKDGDYHWFIGNMSVLEMKNGRPWRFIVSIQNLEEMNDTRNQLIQLIRENLQLKNKLRFESLSKREKQIVKVIANGQTDKEIAVNLSISPATVKTHRHSIIQKLQLKNKASIAQFAAENGLD